MLIAMEHGMENLRLICEPTGQYHNKLFRAARSKGFFTCFVNAESVSKFRVIETNDSGKTDFKDPRVIRTLGKLDKVIKHRMLSEDYLLLRKLNTLYDEIEGELIRSRCRIDKVLTELFCDYSFKNDFFYLPSGQTLIELYGCNPYRIIKAEFEEFSASMKKATPRIQNSSLQRLWKDAESSVLNQQPEGYIDILEMHLKQLTEDWRTQMGRKNDVVERILCAWALEGRRPQYPAAYRRSHKRKEHSAPPRGTGPLSDFADWRRLMRYGGLNIRMRQSGKYQGQNKISKKGRPLMRKVLQNIALPLVRKGYLYGEYYHQKRELQKMPGTKAMTCVARHFLKKFSSGINPHRPLTKRGSLPARPSTKRRPKSVIQ